MEKSNSVLLFSGGIDSYIAYHYLNKPKTVYFNTGSRYSQRESKVVQKLIPSTIIDTSLDLSTREAGENAFIPFRNLLFAAQAVKYADIIYIIGIEDDRVGDKTEEAFKKMSDTLSLLIGRRIEVKSPFWNMSKSEIVSLFIKSYGTVDDLLQTISCYSEVESSNYCGRCPSCFRKWVALWKFVGDKRDFLFYDFDLLNKYLARAEAGVFTEKRNKAIIETINGYYGMLHSNSIVVDIDDTITIPYKVGVDFDYPYRKPNLVFIETLKLKKAQGWLIHLHTSRLPQDEEVTKKWLLENDVPYHFLTMGKPMGSIYVDDKACLPKDFLI